MKNIWIFIFFLLTASSSFSGTWEGKVDMIQVGRGYTPENVYFLVRVVADRVNKPACAGEDRMAINPASEAGKVMVSMLIAAKMSQQPVELLGTNNCDLMNGFESINYMRIKP